MEADNIEVVGDGTATKDREWTTNGRYNFNFMSTYYRSYKTILHFAECSIVVQQVIRTPTEYSPTEGFLELELCIIQYYALFP